MRSMGLKDLTCNESAIARASSASSEKLKTVQTIPNLMRFRASVEIRLRYAMNAQFAGPEHPRRRFNINVRKGGKSGQSGSSDF